MIFIKAARYTSRSRYSRETEKQFFALEEHLFNSV